MSRLRSYSELQELDTFEERFKYLVLKGRVGDPTFGFERYINQRFYRSTQWRQARNRVIARDLGCDLGINGREIYTSIYVHHMNPMNSEDIMGDDSSILDPEYLISVTHDTHNAIHYGDETQVPQVLTERAPGDTQLWGRGR